MSRHNSSTAVVAWVAAALTALAVTGLITGLHVPRSTADDLAGQMPPAAAPPSTAPPSTAPLKTLASVPVLPTRPDRPGYDRDCTEGHTCSFGRAWTDDTDAPDGGNGCDTRDDVLREQLTGTTHLASSPCVIVAGHLADPYTGSSITFSKADAAAVQIDHLVPLALAWDLGAWRWTPAERARYANDTATELVAVDGPTNEAKGDQGPAAWMPPDPAAACWYVTRFIAVLAAYHLPITADDHLAVATTLSTCH